MSVTLITRTLLGDFAVGASDLDAVCNVAERSGGVLSLSSLHAKVYVIDKRKALVTSANATYSGMYRNWECGIEVTARAQVDTLVQSLHSGFGCPKEPVFWTLQDLIQLRGSVEVLRSAFPKSTRKRERASDRPQKLSLRRPEMEKFSRSLTGWLQLTLDGVLRIPAEIFSMQQVFDSCAPLAILRYPGNRHVRQKLRQQMQRLRDLGLVVFLGNGQYERMI
ncbi:MAG: phospholipase D-like domain-containing protein [Verrucomicrobiota bacterium]|nr:phospholipase D-like domain-containing protein [Verrucomicrobiota bacterium]